MEFSIRMRGYYNLYFRFKHKNGVVGKWRKLELKDGIVTFHIGNLVELIVSDIEFSRNKPEDFE